MRYLRGLLIVVGAVIMVIAPSGSRGGSPPAAAEAAQSPGRWNSERAWAWYKAHPWIVGVNYHPSNVVNSTELWSGEVFDEKLIDRELSLAQRTGFSACRTFLQYLVWQHDPQGMKQRMGRFLTIAEKHGIAVIFVLFDDCAFGAPPTTEPYWGKQKEPIPGMIMSSWTPSPGLKAVTDRARWPDLEKYVKDIVGTFARDKRVLLWDVYNEPGNSGMDNRSLGLFEAAMAWARQADPIQPLTAGIWNDGLHDLNRAMIERSDVITFHAYANNQGMQAAIRRYKGHERPVICTEWMARSLGSRFESELALFRREGVGCLSWGLVNGRMQCQFSWWDKRGTPEPKVWFSDLFHKDQTPYDVKEIEAIRQITAQK